MNSSSSHTSNLPLNKDGRIEYIDAMRGFTMILVVLNHVALYCLGISRSVPSYHIYLQEIQMPLFFFISGFVLYKPNVQWGIKHTAKFITRKIPVLIVSPFIFFFIYLYLNHIPFWEGLYNEVKCGYWFTLVLFVFLVYYSLIRFILKIINVDNSYSDFIILILGFSFYFIRYLPLNVEIKNLFCMSNWYLFIFFVIGTLTRKHLNHIQVAIDKTPLILIAILIFFLFNIFEKFIGLHFSLVLLFLTSLSGVVLVFSFFKNRLYFWNKESTVSSCLQFIGKRTLDIYLIHFFLLPVFLKDLVSDSLTSNPFPFIDMTISIFIALIVIGGSLLISNIIRLSPFLVHWLFGAKYPAKN